MIGDTPRTSYPTKEVVPEGLGVIVEYVGFPILFHDNSNITFHDGSHIVFHNYVAINADLAYSFNAPRTMFFSEVLDG